MADHSIQADADRSDAARPWHILVAFGLAGSEVGIVVDAVPVAVVGLVMFAASVAGILSDAEYVERPVVLAAVFGIAFVIVGTVLAAHGTETFPIGILEPLSGLTSRGAALVFAGFVIIVGAGFMRSLQR